MALPKIAPRDGWRAAGSLGPSGSTASRTRSRRSGGPEISVITPVNDAPFGPHNLCADLPHTIFEGTGHWLQMDKSEELNRILDEFLARVEVSRTSRS